MTRTQVQFPDPLYEKLKRTAEKRDWSLAEVLRRAAEAYLLTIDDDDQSDVENWELPVLKPSGGFLRDPATIRAEAEVVLERVTGAR